jgi:hypothetical protein
MLWNVRIVRSVVDGQERFRFHEVEQERDADAPHAIHPEPFNTDGKDVKELYDKLRHMLGAIKQPVLDIDTLPSAE